MKQILERFEAVEMQDWFSKVEKRLQVIAQGELASEVVFGMERYVLDKDEYQWKASEVIEVDDIKKGNQALEKALMHGVVAPVLVIDKSMTVRELEDLLDEIPLNYTAINFEIKEIDLVKTFLSKLYRSRGLWTNLKGTFAIKTASGADLMRLIEQVNAVLPQFKLLSLNAQKYYQGKSQTIQELVNTLVEADNIFKTLVPQDLSENRIQQQTFVTFTIDEHIFTSIAKVKAFRQLWLRLAKRHYVAFPFAPAIHLRTLPSNEVKIEEYILQTMLQMITGIFSEAHQIILTPFKSFKVTNQEEHPSVHRAIHEGIKAAYEFPFFKKETAPLEYIDKMTEELVEIAWRKFEVDSQK